MADIKISALPTATTPLTGAELVPIVQGGVTKQTTTSDVLAVPVTSLTASSAVATDASKKLVSVANTGTGNNVLATSPTLVTPALGTPSALVGTNITGTAAGLTAGNVTTNANLTGAVTSVGNTTSLGSFTSANLAAALTDETGTGANVFATSPTLITPILGTPQSVTLTNATDLPLTTGVTGLLPVASGGTGTATPALVAGSNVTITGSWPNQTINSTGGGGGGSGTVTSVSVVSANGLAGTVANATTTPAITLSTSVTGVVKGNGTTLSAATAGTDYVAPGGALGTPSSGTVTNLTGTASININGTVGATTPAAGTFTSLNTGQLAGLRNRIINGGMTIDQRNAGAAQTITAAAALAYTVDRFYAYSTGANVTGQQVAGSLQSQKRYRFTGAASVAAIGFGTRLEAVNTYDLNDKTVTISADIANSLLTTVTWTLFRATTTDNTFGTLAAPTVTSLGTGTFTVTSTVTNYNAQVTLPTAATTGLQLVFTVGAQTSGTWTIGNVQLEIGSVATPFEQRPYGMELALCQRYYFRVYPGAGNQRYALGSVISTTNLSVTRTFPVVMRVAPSALEQSGTATDYLIAYSATAAACSAVPTFVYGTTSASTFNFTIGSGLTVGNAAEAAANSANSYLGWSAEL